MLRLPYLVTAAPEHQPVIQIFEGGDSRLRQAGDPHELAGGEKGPGEPLLDDSHCPAVGRPGGGPSQEVFKQKYFIGVRDGVGLAFGDLWWPGDAGAGDDQLPVFGERAAGGVAVKTCLVVWVGTVGLLERGAHVGTVGLLERGALV
ncbi:hypothetical protein Pmani_014201 [Petrolisthes manimaculis]|uniref:Uncharacterized protein n=1 Tax=Petrolisthes manimaculis TaxID=1843537 RepID=A0AAE1UB92_9EUCA|nr:hypothetical protein Pmani_014201 [Petrolisthes manimaculis]